MIKKILLAAIVLSMGIKAYSQSPADTTMATYLKVHRYILLSDSTHLPQNIQPYYTAMMAFADGDHAYLKNCYIPAGGTLDEQYAITVTLLDMASIRILKKYDEGRAANVRTYGGPGEVPMVVAGKNPPSPQGNLSGLDGKLIINN